jgi:cobalt-zinc-cadmium efflux system outer membrane protein
MASARLRAGRLRRSACLLGLAGAALACQTPASVRHRMLAEDFRRSDPAIQRASEADAALFADRERLDRRTLVAAVLERNPNLEVARQAWRAAIARYPQVTSLDDPMLGVGVAPLSFGSNAVDPGARFDLSQRLPFPGKRRLRGEAALAEAEAAGQDLETLRLELAALACQLFDDLVLVARALEINTIHAALLGEAQRTALARYAAGEDEKQSVLQAELATTRALYERIELENQSVLVAQQINTLLHRPADRPLPAPPDAIVLPEGPSDPVEDLVARALAERPELGAAQALARAAEARVDLAAREFLPDFTLVGAYDRVWQETALQPFVGLQLNVPLALGRRRAALEESRAELAGREHRRSALEDDVRLAVESAALRLAQARHAEELVRDRLLPAAGEQVDAARTAYAAGRGGFPTLIDALRERHEIELGHQQARAQIAQRRAELDRALGRIPGLEW